MKVKLRRGGYSDSDKGMIEKFLSNKEVTKAEDEPEDAEHVDYRRTSKSYSELHLDRIVQTCQKNGLVRAKNKKLEFKDSLEKLASLKPKDAFDLIGLGISIGTCVVSINYYTSKKSGRAVTRYFCSNGKFYTPRIMKQKCELYAKNFFQYNGSPKQIEYNLKIAEQAKEIHKVFDDTHEDKLKKFS